MRGSIRAVVAGSVAGAYLLGLASAGVLTSDPPPSIAPADDVPGAPTSERQPPEAPTSRSTTTRSGMASGFARDENGARDAAIAYATAPQRWLYLSDDEMVAAVRAVATVGGGEQLAREVVDEVSLARDGLAASAGPVWWLVRPLAWRLEAYSPDRARVAVWTVTVLSAADVAVPQADWLTVTVELAWEAGEWRVDELRDTAGPTPIVGVRDEPWQPEPFDDALAGFERLDSAAAR